MEGTWAIAESVIDAVFVDFFFDFFDVVAFDEGTAAVSLAVSESLTDAGFVDFFFFVFFDVVAFDFDGPFVDVGIFTSSSSSTTLRDGFLSLAPDTSAVNAASLRLQKSEGFPWT